MSRSILIISNNDSGLYQFRNELIEKLTENNNVTLCLPDGEYKQHFIGLGCQYVPIEFNRHGTNPIKDLQLLHCYKTLISNINPDIVFTYTIKPNVYGGMACAARKVPYVANVTGLGTAIENGGLMQRLTLALYKRGLYKAQKVFFQNSANRDFMLKHGVVKGEYDLLPGSGVNLKRHCMEEYPENDGTLTLLFIGRLMKDKGIEELIRASTIIREKHAIVNFVALGECEPDYQERFHVIKEGCPIRFMGSQSDVHGFIKNSHAVVLPTYHEGMSNVLQEAAACGRPVLASDIPGCRETFEEGVSGFGFKPKDVDSLCEAIEKFIDLPYEKKAEMGRVGRRKMEREFDRSIVVRKYIAEIEKLEKGS